VQINTLEQTHPSRALKKRDLLPNHPTAGELLGPSPVPQQGEGLKRAAQVPSRAKDGVEALGALNGLIWAPTPPTHPPTCCPVGWGLYLSPSLGCEHSPKLCCRSWLLSWMNFRLVQAAPSPRWTSDRWYRQLCHQLVGRGCHCHPGHCCTRVTLLLLLPLTGIQTSPTQALQLLRLTLSFPLDQARCDMM